MAEYLIQDSTLAAIGNAIREKTGKTGTLTPTEMTAEISNIETGAELNFKVVGGTTQPSNPTENTIWVNTSTSITSWIFSATQPSTTTDGTVWIQIGAASPAELDILTNGGIYVHPISVKQYVSGAWTYKDAKSYKGGKWVSFWNGKLYEAGDEYSDITGGWLVYGESSKNTATIQTGAWSGGQGLVRTKNKINLNGYSKLCINVTAVTKSCSISVSSNAYANGKTAYEGGSHAVWKTISSTGVNTFDISNVNDSYYVMVGDWSESNSYNCTFNKIWLE